jgi:apolipoprotein N-acyltransferase
LALAFACLAPLTPKQAFGWGFLSGVPQYAGSLFWILSVGRVAPLPLILIAVSLLIAYMSLWSGLWAWLFAHSHKRRFGLFLYPFLWVGVELVRSSGELAFPWNHLGYDLGNHLALIQGASLVGVFGLSLALVGSGLLIWLSLSSRLPRPVLALVAVFWAAWIGWGAWNLNRPQVGPSLRVAVVQPAVPQTKKWNEAYFAGVMAKTFDVASRIQGPVDLVAFPETAMPDFWPLRPLQSLRLTHLSDSLKTDVVIGALDFDRDPAAPKGAYVRNGAFLLTPEKPVVWRYDKIFLVPFGERVPFDWIPLINKVELEQGGFSAGHEIKVQTTAGVPWAPSLCYELIYPELARMAHEKGARMLVNLTNDGWFGQSIGPWQHFNIQRFRAVESGMPLVRSANTGISAVVDRHGRVLASSRLMSDTVIAASVTSGLPDGSFYVRNGRWIENLLMLLGLLSAVALRFLPKIRETSPPH